MDNILTNQFFKLINRFFEKRYSKNLEDKVHHWLISPENSQEKQKAMRQQWDSLSNIEDLSSQLEFEKIKKVLGFTENKRKIQFSNYLPRVVAVLLPLILFAGIYFLDKRENKDSDMPMTVLTVPYGKHEEAKLACGSEIWINSGSEISYNENPADTVRTVNLKGEAYFSVMRQNDVPFIVRTEYLDVKVLGTKFNVSAYPDEESTIVTLNKGSIAIRTVDNHDYMLKPNQQLVYNNKTRQVVIQDLDVNIAKDIADWTIGKMAFNNETLKDIVTVFERKFNVDVEVDSNVDLNRRYTVTIDEGDNLKEIIEIFGCFDNSLSYKIDNNKVYISNNKTE
ncbi:DUF4974 domain-containing protein [Dysgonomonas sp. HDW5B]|uniref:FecR family protein n=1 Tax=Dysgonomonas sp. HDW5B TaxID=2714927 RepID=UPI00140852E3|nr:FecR family protein [Dysgonomonas sp. HDW5B]QIK55510.1 DUF4974 domain-containing protein [Dysgonomonas sp. HDW5B]